MPLGPNIRYRTTKKDGKTIRLAFRGKGEVVEAKNLKTGKTHTPEEFALERARRGRMKRKG